MGSSSDLTALVGSRICHDLVNPLGAIGNGVELMGMTGGGGEEMALISEAVEAATARLNFFRVAFGAAEEGQMLPRSGIVPVLSAVSRGGRTSYEWRPAGDVTRQEARIAFLLLQCMEHAMPLGGHITVHDNWTIVAEAKRLRIEQELWDSLTHVEVRGPLTVAQVQFGLLPRALAAAGRRLSIEVVGDEIRAAF